VDRVLAVMLCYNTCEATEQVLERFPAERDYDVLLINDGSTDRTGEVLSQCGFEVVEHETNRGLGAALRTGIAYALKNHYDVVAIMAGNGKDSPQGIPDLVRPILEGRCDYVQGSRFLRGGRSDNLPLSRYLMIRAFGILLSLIFRVRITDPANGFRAYRLDILKDKRINIWQDWLDHYEFETYLNTNVLRFGYRYCEVPVSKVYPKNKKRVKYSHIRPFVDWWSIVRPLFMIYLHIKK
jgi:dolichol-phosphate mannosyltransferase